MIILLFMPQFEIDYSTLLFWTDAHISPSVAKWLIQAYGVQAASVRSLHLRESDDLVIFLAARDANAILISKDIDILKLQFRLGQPPKVIWLTCGNTSNKILKEILYKNFTSITESLVMNNDAMIEITD